MNDPTQTQDQPPEPERTHAVADLYVHATAAGIPTVATLARANRPTVSGYELLEVVGKGGMGIVYRAKQVNLDRDIAIKFLRDDYHPMSSTGLRFMEEARITAQLQHPSIPAVHEVGTLPDSRPYLVMKLIRGRTLDTMLKEDGPGATKWLAVFEAICHGVGFAHAHQVVHRDLKPSNVMVGAFGEVQVMDWGLAKVLGRDALIEHAARADTGEHESISSLRDSGSVQTRAGSYLGTPAFMAPEQATGAIDEVSARTDVFGLGAVLCTLLTGQPPYLGVNSETTRLMAAATKLDECFARLEASGAEPELIELCKRCLAANPEARPADGSAVAKEVASLRLAADERARQADLDRARTEVHAAEQSKRRRTVMIAAGLISAVLLLGLIGTGLSYFKAVEAKNEEAKQRTKAESNERIAIQEKAVSDSTLKFFLTDMLGQADAKEQANARLRSGASYETQSNPTVRDLLDRVATALTPEVLEANFPNQPVAQAKILGTVGRTYRGVGEPRKAIPFMERAYETYRKTLGDDDSNTVESLNNLALTYRDALRTKDAIAKLTALLEYRTAKHGATQRNTLLSENNLAMALLDDGRIDDATAHLTKVRDALKALPVPELAEDRKAQEAFILQAEHNLAVADYKRAKMGEAATGTLDQAKVAAVAKTFEAIRVKRDALLKPDHPDSLDTLDNLALALQDKGEVREAIKLYEFVLAARSKTHGLFHPFTLATRNKIALAYLAGGAESADLLKESFLRFKDLLGVCVKALGEDHAVTLGVRHNLAQAYIDAITLKDADAEARLPDAIALLEAARLGRERILTYEHDDTIQTVNLLAFAYMLDGNTDQAARLFEHAYEAAKNQRGPFRPHPLIAKHNLASILKKKGDRERCVKLHLEAAEFVKQGDFKNADSLMIVVGACNDLEEFGLFTEAEPWRKVLCMLVERAEGEATESARMSRELAFYGRNLLKQKKWSEAAKVLKRSFEIRRKNEGGSPGYFNVSSLYGEALFGEKKFKEAEPLLLEGYVGLKRFASEGKVTKNSLFIVSEAGQRLLALYVETKDDKASALRKELFTDDK